MESKSISTVSIIETEYKDLDLTMYNRLVDASKGRSYKHGFDKLYFNSAKDFNEFYKKMGLLPVHYGYDPYTKRATAFTFLTKNHCIVIFWKMTVTEGVVFIGYVGIESLSKSSMDTVVETMRKYTTNDGESIGERDFI